PFSVVSRLVSCMRYVYIYSRLSRPPSSILLPFTTLFRSFVLDHAVELDDEELTDQEVDAPHPESVDITDGDLAAHLVPQVLQQRSEEHTSELQSRENLVCRLLLVKKKANTSRALLRYSEI